MTSIKNRAAKIRTLVIGLAFFCAATAVAQDGSICTVNGIMGTVKVFSARARGADPNNVSTWPDARLNMSLRANDRIATLAESEVRLETADGSTVRLRENTTITIDMLSGGANAINARFQVANGGVIANVKRMAGGKSTFELETPTSLAAIRGTTVELISRPGAGTTIATFDGHVQVAAGGRRNNRVRWRDLRNFDMTEIAAGDQDAFVRSVPSFYRPKSTKLLSEYDKSELTGFRRVILTIDELEEVQRMLEADGIASSIGIGESDNEMTARTISADAARAQLATAMSTQVQRISESYAQNIGGQAKTVWEESVRQMTNVTVRGSSVHRTITQYHEGRKIWKVYSLMVLDPSRLRHVMTGVTNNMEQEFELRVKKDDMMARMDASINAFNTRYHDR